MPYLSVKTNTRITPTQERAFLASATECIETLLDKPRAVVMVEIGSGRAMAFGGTEDPAAFLRLKSIGLDVTRCPELAQALTALVDATLGIPPDRVFIDLQDLDRARFAWNGKTFG